MIFQLVKINVPQQSLPDIAGCFFGSVHFGDPLGDMPRHHFMFRTTLVATFSQWRVGLGEKISKCMWYICASQEQRQKPSCDMVLLVWFVYSHSNHGLFPDPCSTSQWNPTVGTPLMVYTTHSRKKCRSFIKVEAFLHTIIQP